MLQCLPAKTPSEAKTVTFSFGNVASGGIAFPVVTKTTIVGTDPAAVALSISAPSISGANILVLVLAGANNCSYTMICTIADASGQIHQDGATLTVTTDAA